MDLPVHYGLMDLPVHDAVNKTCESCFQGKTALLIHCVPNSTMTNAMITNFVL